MARVYLALALGIAFLWPAAALAGSPREAGFLAAAPDDSARSGFYFGASVGRGRLDIACAGCGDLAPLSEALSVSVLAGAMLTPRLALEVEYWAVRWDGRDNSWFGDSEDHLVQESLTTAGAQVWLGRRLWLRGGVGVSRHRTDVSYRAVEGGTALPASAGGSGSTEPPSGKAPAVTGAIGFEIIYTPTFAVDLALRAGASGAGERGVKTGTAALTLGATWF